MRQSLAQLPERAYNTFNGAIAGLLVPITLHLADNKLLHTFGGAMPSEALWLVTCGAEIGKAAAASAKILQAVSSEKFSQLFKNFMFTVIAPAAYATACYFAVMQKQFFGKPADALVFAPAFLYDGITKLISAFEKYKKGEAYANEFAAGMGMLMISAGVAGIVFNKNPMVALAPAGALLNLFKDVFFDKPQKSTASTVVSSNANSLFAPTVEETTRTSSVRVEPSTTSCDESEKSEPLLTNARSSIV